VASEIEVIKPLGFAKDIMQDTIKESKVLAIVDSLNREFALPYEKYTCPPEITLRAMFTDLPKILYYRVYGCNINYNPENRFSYAFYNETESTTYIPNGDIKAFNKVFSVSLKNNFRPIFILNLLSIYVNAAAPWKCNLIYGSDDDMMNLYHWMNRDNLTWYILTEIKWLKELYPQLDEPIKIIQDKDKFRFEFNTYDLERIINHWVFDVYPDSISLISNSVLKSNITLQSKQDSLFQEMNLYKNCPR
jgi:hypothetical protein